MQKICIHANRKLTIFIMPVQHGEIIDRLQSAKALPTRAALAAFLGVAPQRINEAIRRRQIPESWIYKVAYETGLAVEWLRTGKGLRWHVRGLEFSVASQEVPTYGKTKPRLVPVLNWVQAGAMASAVDPYPYAGAAEEHLSISVRGNNCIALQIRGDSMLPEFQPGDLVVIDPEQRQVSSGAYVVVKDDESEEATFKQYVKKKDGSVLKPLNNEYKEIPFTPEKHRIVGKVVRKIRSY